MWLTSLGVAKAGNFKLDLMAKKASEFSFHFFWNIFRCYRNTKTSESTYQNNTLNSCFIRINFFRENVFFFVTCSLLYS